MIVPRDYHEECVLIVTAFLVYLAETNPATEIYDRFIIYPFATVVIIYWAVRTVRRVRSNRRRKV